LETTAAGAALDASGPAGVAARPRGAAQSRTQGTMDMKTRHPTLGSLLRGLRSRNGWTLKEMSERIDIPVSTLSKVEHDRLTLSYDKLLQLSQRLNIRMSELFADPAGDAEPAVTARRSIGAMDDAVRVNTKNYDYYYLCPELRRKRMIPVYTRIRAKSLAEFGELVHHSGEEYIYVVEGAIVAHTEFYDPIELGAGESIYIDSAMGHAYTAAKGCKEAVVLAVCSSADESLLESLYSLHGDVEPQPPAPARSPKPRPRARAAATARSRKAMP
jgi:transcriptional regulator with XRE-family HTH domain